MDWYCHPPPHQHSCKHSMLGWVSSHLCQVSLCDIHKLVYPELLYRSMRRNCIHSFTKVTVRYQTRQKVEDSKVEKTNLRIGPSWGVKTRQSWIGNAKVGLFSPLITNNGLYPMESSTGASKDVVVLVELGTFQISKHGSNSN